MTKKWCIKIAHVTRWSLKKRIIIFVTQQWPINTNPCPKMILKVFFICHHRLAQSDLPTPVTSQSVLKSIFFSFLYHQHMTKRDQSTPSFAPGWSWLVLAYLPSPFDSKWDFNTSHRPKVMLTVFYEFAITVCKNKTCVHETHQHRSHHTVISDLFFFLYFSFSVYRMKPDIGLNK